jgi:hypothetical protein
MIHVVDSILVPGAYQVRGLHIVWRVHPKPGVPGCESLASQPVTTQSTTFAPHPHPSPRARETDA